MRNFFKGVWATIIWFVKLLTLQPHEVISRFGKPYLIRWHLLPPFTNRRAFIHKFVGDDEDEALHDHPWPSWSLLLRGQYREHTPQGSRVFRAGAWIPRSAEYQHRIALIDGKPAWTLFITGRKTRSWGFWCPQGFRPWIDFKSQPDGKGCE